MLLERGNSYLLECLRYNDSLAIINETVIKTAAELKQCTTTKRLKTFAHYCIFKYCFYITFLTIVLD